MTARSGGKKPPDRDKFFTPSFAQIPVDPVDNYSPSEASSSSIPTQSPNQNVESLMKYSPLSGLSVQAKKTAEAIGQQQYFTTPSNDDLKTLEKEIQALKTIFEGNQEALTEMAKVSANIRRTINRKVKYELTDQGPFLVLMEGTESKVGNMHPMNMGKIFHRASVQGINNIVRKGANKIGVEFRTSEFANQFLDNDNFGTKEGYNKYIPQRLVTCRGTIKDIGDQITEDDFYSEASAWSGSKNNSRKIKILNVRRITRRKKVISSTGGTVMQSVPTNDYIVTFEGKTLPEKVNVYNNEREVNRYINPVIMCINCCRFGHIKNNCRGKSRCGFCSEDHFMFQCEKREASIKKLRCPEEHVNNLNRTCSYKNCEINPKPTCVNCGGQHSATDRSCPEYSRQKKINETMAFYNFSFFEAEKMFPRNPNPNKEFVRRSEDFPSLSGQLQPKITRPKSPQGGFSYTSVTKRRKTAPTISQGYDKIGHKRALFPSQSRVKSTPMEVQERTSSESEREESLQVKTWDEICKRFDEFKKEIMSIRNIDPTCKDRIQRYFGTTDLRREGGTQSTLHPEGGSH